MDEPEEGSADPDDPAEDTRGDGGDAPDERGTEPDPGNRADTDTDADAADESDADAGDADERAASDDEPTVDSDDEHAEDGDSPDDRDPDADSGDDGTTAETSGGEPSDDSNATTEDSEDADADDDAGGLTRVEPPEDVPRPEKPPAAEHPDEDAGGLRRVDPDEDISGDNGAGGPDGDGDAHGDGEASDDGVGHGAHPAEHHEPVTGDTGPQPAGHSAGVPSPGDDEYEEWIQGLRDQNPDPVPEPDVDSSAREDAEADASAAVAGPTPATEGDVGADADGSGESAEADGPPSPPAAESSVGPDLEPDEGPPAGDGVGAAPSSPGPEEPDFGAVGEPDAPPDDEEMPLSAHIEEMIRRLAVVVIAAGLATAVAFPSAESLLNTMWYGVLPPKVPSPTLYGPLEKLLSEIKVASLAGILIALPVLVYEAYLFMRPGLYPKERRYFLAAVPTSLVLGSIGMSFAYFVILPVLFSYFITYSESAVDALPFGLRVTFDLIVSLLGAFALVFQIPLLIMLAVMIGVVTRRWLEEQRILFWGLFLGVGFFISLGDATGTAPIIIALTMISLFEGTLALLRWTGRN